MSADAVEPNVAPVNKIHDSLLACKSRREECTCRHHKGEQEDKNRSPARSFYNPADLEMNRGLVRIHPIEHVYTVQGSKPVVTSRNCDWPVQGT